MSARGRRTACAAVEFVVCGVQWVRGIVPVPLTSHLVASSLHYLSEYPATLGDLRASLRASVQFGLLEVASSPLAGGLSLIRDCCAVQAVVSAQALLFGNVMPSHVEKITSLIVSPQ